MEPSARLNPPHPLSYRESLQAFLREDWGTQDWSSASVPDRRVEARIVAKESLVLAGLEVAREVFRAVDPNLEVRCLALDGEAVVRGREVLHLSGSSRAILMGERVSLNLLQRLSGTATLTRAFVDAVAGTRARILDTRKTTPGLKLLEKYAVRCGGGFNHRLTLGDGLMLKENHIAAAGGIAPAVAIAREVAPSLVRIEVEAETLEQVRECLAIDGVDVVLLDNMSNGQMAEAVGLRDQSGRRLLLEASGNMSLERARSVAETGVDFISVGALTHSAPAADLSLRMA
ncbi:carboxylating nicotinate-nucleotide diphosphorylase [Holophaga foetida]|uniref:carboxylating nicotinate-nucleotide diphosphorylase n=1 Tax=Holophaga foetida TaxID=35839 RepID=UPI0002471C38|nr:carboxylating nicotinate-nucleotide diphosphorylase [Holophaga foetida]